MESTTPSSAPFTRAAKQGQAASHSTFGAAEAAALNVVQRRVAELESPASAQSRELAIQFERIAQLQADFDILRIRFIKP